MVRLFAALAVIAAVAMAFFSRTWAWLPVAVLDAFIVYVYRGLQARPLVPPTDVSPVAQELFRQFGHFYTNPSAGSSFSSASSILAIGGPLPALVLLVRGHWFALVIAIVNYLAMGWAGWHFNPTRVLGTPEERRAHAELFTRLHRPPGSGTPAA